MGEPERLPIIDVAPLVGGGDSRGTARVAREIDAACRAAGFFYAVGHAVDPTLHARLEELSRLFFAQDPEQKLAIRMERGGRAWRGYFSPGGELTDGLPDRKEGIYFGAELGDDDPRVRAGTPLHGRNLFPASPAGLREAVLETMSALTRLGHVLMEGIALGLGLERSFFARRYTGDPFILFRIFHYPPVEATQEAEQRWGVGEHTDYGMLTILAQDESGGLEVKSRGRWIDAPHVPGSFVCNLGDMLDRMTAGRYRSTPHRVRIPRERGRLSFPFFFDPAFDARVEPLAIDDGWLVPEDRAERWDRASLRELGGTYGEYLLAKVGRVFPDLGRDVLGSAPASRRP